VAVTDAVTRNWGGGTRFVALLAALFWSGLLCFSGVAKLMEPWAAVALAERMGFPGPEWIVALTASAEISVGGLFLLSLGQSRFGRWSLTGVACGFLLIRAFFRTQIEEGCGCFGNVIVPPLILDAAVVVGLISGVSVMYIYRDKVCTKRWFAGVVAMIFVGGVGVSWLNVFTEDSSREIGGLIELAERGSKLLMVGSYACSDCRDRIKELRKLFGDEFVEEKLVFVVRYGEFQATGLLAGSVSVSSRIWWSLARGGTPRFLCVRDGRLEPVADAVKFLVARM
jgi:hypothetical protein